MKGCKGCGESKPLTEFHRSTYWLKKRGWGDGYRHICKSCWHERYVVPCRGDVNRERNYRRKFGIGLDDYNRLLDEQDGVCALCGQEEPKAGRNLCVDHDHETGNIRGLLCSLCNHAMERVDNVPGWLEKAQTYKDLSNT